MRWNKEKELHKIKNKIILEIRSLYTSEHAQISWKYIFWKWTYCLIMFMILRLSCKLMESDINEKYLLQNL